MKMEFTDGPGPSVIKHNPQPQLRSILIAFVYLILFILLDLLTKQFEVFPGIVTWYPPAGLTYALLLVFGVRFTPAVTIALFLSSVFIHRMPQPPLMLFLWSFVISFIYSAAAWFLRHRIHLDWKLRKLRDVAWLVVTAVLVSAFLAILSVSGSALGSEIPRNEFLRSIFHWWIGEAVGVLTVTPFLLIFVMPLLKRFVDGKPERFSSAHRSFPFSTISAIGQAASLLIVLYWVFGIHLLGEYHPEFLIILPVIWIALTRGLKGTTAAILILNFGVVLAQWFFRFDLMRLGELELLMIVNCIVGLLMGAVVTERQRVTEEIANLAVFPFENPNIILRLSRDGIVLFANPASDALLRMWGCSLGGLAPQFWRDLASQVLTSKKNKTMDIECEGKFIELFIVPVTTPDYVNLYGRDITEQKQALGALQESEEKFRGLFENTQAIMLLIDPESSAIIDANPAACAFYGWSLEDLKLKKITDFNSLTDAEVKTEMRKAQEKMQNQFRFQHRLSGGEIREVGVASSPIMHKGRTLLFSIVWDTTERKRAEEEITTQLDELQRWQTATLGRENRIFELKHEVNELLAETNQVPRYPSAESYYEQEQ